MVQPNLVRPAAILAQHTGGVPTPLLFCRGLPATLVRSLAADALLARQQHVAAWDAGAAAPAGVSFVSGYMVILGLS